MGHVRDDLLAPVGFRPLETFEAMVNRKRNRYLAGRVYTIRPEAVYQDLYDQARQWAGESKIEWCAPGASVAARMSTEH